MFSPFQFLTDGWGDSSQISQKHKYSVLKPDPRVHECGEEFYMVNTLTWKFCLQGGSRSSTDVLHSFGPFEEKGFWNQPGYTLVKIMRVDEQ